jgi:cell division protein DivIC
MNQTMASGNMKTSKKLIGSRRRRRILYAVLFSFLLWAAYMFTEQIDHLQEQRRELSKMQAELGALQKQHSDYKGEIERLNDLEYIEQLARKEYFLSKRGEILFITPHSDSN